MSAPRSLAAAALAALGRTALGRTALGWTALAWTALACGRAPAGAPSATPPPAREVRFQELIADPKPPATYDPTTKVQVCADESHMAIALEAGDRRTFTATLRSPTELLLGACVERRRRHGAEIARELRARLFRPDGRREDHVLTLGEGWSTGRYPIAAEGGEVRIRLAADLPAGERLFVRDVALRSEREAPAPPARPRALLISLDAFREDAIGAIGGRTKTPALDRLLAESERFLPHWSAEISTKPSHATMLTGLPAAVHGCDRTDSALPASVSTLAERIAATGAATGASASVAPYFNERFGLNQGFVDYRLSAWTNAQQLRHAVDWAAANRERASFQFVHLYGAHSDFALLPYEAAGMTRAAVADAFEVADYGCRNGHCASALLLSLNWKVVPPIAHEEEIVRFLYDRGVETLDAELGRFFDELRRMGLWDETLVIVTADHGEAFGEHGYYLHTTVHEETLRVPLLVKWPRVGAPDAKRAGTVTNRPSTSLDLAPTLLAAFGLEASDLVGSDLGHPAPEGAAAMISKDAVRLGDLKLLFETREAPRALYDLARDPAERANLLPGAAAEAERLAGVHERALERARRLHGRPIEVGRAPYTPEEIERLRSLGYLN